jgi:Cu+-exporting ATPase
MRAEDVAGNNYFLGAAKTGTDGEYNLALYKNQALLAQIAIQDDIKPETANLITQLKKWALNLYF